MAGCGLKSKKQRKRNQMLQCLVRMPSLCFGVETLFVFLLRHSTKILGEKKSIIKIQEVVLLQDQEKCKTLLPSFTFIFYMIRLFTFVTVCAYI